MKKKILILLVLLTAILCACKNKSEESRLVCKQPSSVSETDILDSIYNGDIYAYRIENYKFYSGNIAYSVSENYKYSEILFDSTDKRLMLMDTVLEFSSATSLYSVFINKESVSVSIQYWEDMVRGKSECLECGYQKDGFIYTLDNETGNYIMNYKIVLDKCLFVWIAQYGWISIPAGRRKW